MKLVSFFSFLFFTTLFSCTPTLQAGALTHEASYTKSLGDLEDHPALTPYERMVRGQIKALFKKHIVKHGEPTVTSTEEVVAWLAALVILYQATNYAVDRKWVVIPYLTFDALFAYSQYPIYKSLGHYPSLDYAEVKWPSFSLLGGIFLINVWKKIRGIFERTAFNRYRNLAEIALTDHEEVELDHTTVQALENQCLQLKEELIERGLYKYLYLTTAELVKAFEELDYLGNESQDGDYYKAYKLVGLAQRLINFIKPL